MHNGDSEEADQVANTEAECRPSVVLQQQTKTANSTESSGDVHSRTSFLSNTAQFTSLQRQTHDAAACSHSRRHIFTY